MRVIWEESDIVAGKRIGKRFCEERSIIGYDITEDSKDRYAIVSLIDGQIMDRENKQQLAEWLTTYEYLPEELL